jgi:hypothetical protein
VWDLDSGAELMKLKDQDFGVGSLALAETPHGHTPFILAVGAWSG